MRDTFRLHRFGWFAIAILLLAALAPSVSRAVAFARADLEPFAELCVSAPGTAPSGSDRTAAHIDCPLCVLHAQGAMALPPAAPAVGVPAPLPARAEAGRAAEAPCVPCTDGAAQPRAPPSAG